MSWCLIRLLLQIKQASGAVGPKIGEITDKLVQWQLAHPDATEDEAMRWLSGTL